MESQRQQPPPGGLSPIHCVAWYGNVLALRPLMKTGRVLIDYQDMYGNTALHYATFNGHDEFVIIRPSSTRKRRSPAFHASRSLFVCVPPSDMAWSVRVKKTPRCSAEGRPRIGRTTVPHGRDLYREV